MHYTLQLFDHLLVGAPPLTPKELIQRAWEARQQLKAEDELLPHLKALWPYRQAWHEWQRQIETNHARAFFLAHVPLAAKARFALFELHGGTVSDLMGGKPAGFFSADERPAIVAALSAMRRDVAAHALQALHGTGRGAYGRVLSKWHSRFTRYEQALSRLEEAIPAIASESEQVVREIRGFIRACDDALSALGPPVALHAVEGAAEYFLGRAKDHAAFQRLR